MSDWRERALCVGDPMFHNQSRAGIERATRICQDCPVWRSCEEWVSGEKDYEGVAAGRYWRKAKPMAPVLSRPRARFEWDDYDHLANLGVSLTDIAERFGIQRDSLVKALKLRDQEAA
jgi:hypothetical protein